MIDRLGNEFGVGDNLLTSRGIIYQVVPTETTLVKYGLCVRARAVNRLQDPTGPEVYVRLVDAIKIPVSVVLPAPTERERAEVWRRLLHAGPGGYTRGQ